MKSGQTSKLLMIAVVISFLVTSMQAQTYTATDLGTLHAGSARVHGVNESGQAVGASGHPHGPDTHVFFCAIGWRTWHGFPSARLPMMATN